MTNTKSPYRSLFQLGGLALGSVLVIFGLKWFTYADGRLGSKSPTARKPDGNLQEPLARVRYKLPAKPVNCLTQAVPCRKVQIKYSVIINRPAKDLFSFWRKWENLPEFMKQIHTVSVRSETKMFWVKQSLSGNFTAGETEIGEENKSLGGRSQGTDGINEGGLVQFVPTPNGRSTRVNVIMEYDQPSSSVGAGVARGPNELPDDSIREDLRRFKRLMETNETPTT
jgi:uncharacterized membrane protein